ncbi:MAG: DUF3717 domain-containing protein [Pigmentiphaga sp.]
MIVTLNELEQAINYWRQRLPSGEELRLCAPGAALAEPYAELILSHGRELESDHLSEAARVALEGWFRAVGGEQPVQDR